MRLRTTKQISFIKSCAKFLTLAFLLVIFLFYQKAYTEPSKIKFHRINVEDGLSQSDVNDLLQDDLGFIWLATQYGLNRYDGKSYDSFYQEGVNNVSISANNVTRLQKGFNDRIWLQTSYGLDSINQRSLVIENWADIIFAPLLSANLVEAKNKGTISDFQVDDKYLYALVNFKFVVKVDLKTFSSKLMTFNGNVSNSIAGLALLDNELLLFYDKCFAFYDVGSFKLTRKFCSKLNLENYRFNTGSFQGSKLYLPYSEGVYILDLNTLSEKTLKVFDSKTNAYIEADVAYEIDSGYWLGTVSGLKFYDKALGKINEEYWHKPSDQFSLSDNGITRIIKSRDNTLWIATHFGVNLLKPHQSFQHILRKIETETFKLSNATTSIFEDSNKNLWVGTYNSGIYKYNSNRALLENFLALKGLTKDGFLNYVSKVFEDSNQNLWVLAGNGLSVKNINTDIFQNLQMLELDNNSYSLMSMFDVIQDRYSNLWTGSSDGLFKISLNYHLDGSVDLDSISVVNYRDKLPANYLKSDYPIYVLYEDLQGYIWIGGTNGIVRFNPINLKLEHYLHDPDNFSSLSSSDITTIFEDNNGVLWIGTTNGLNRVHYDDEGAIRFKRVGVSDGFISNYISSIQADDSGFLWISTLKGIIRFHPNDAQPVKNYLYEQGLQHSEFYTKSSFRDSDGLMYFGGVNGITLFNPKNVDSELAETEITFSGVTQGKKHLVVQENVVNLETDEPMKVKVSNFDYTSNRELKIRYRIKDFSEWVETDNQYIALHRISSSVVLEVQKLSATGIWITPGIKLQINPKFELLNNNYFWPVTIIVFSIFLLLSYYLLLSAINRQKQKQRLSLKREKAKQSLLMEEKLSLLHQVEDLHYSLSEQKYLVDKVQNELEQQNVKDQVTNLFSRGYILKNVQLELENILQSWAIKGQKGIHLGVFCLEVDNFNTVKELYGHIASNEILSQVADSIKSICYGSDIISRWQGSSILILSRGISQREQMVLSEKIRNIIASRKFDLSNGKTVDVTVSIGFSRYPFLGNLNLGKNISWSKLMFITETALQSAQKNSLNAWVGIYSNQFTNIEILNESIFDELPKLFSSGQLDYVSSIPKSKKINWD